jgi:hypothetical protein
MKYALFLISFIFCIAVTGQIMLSNEEPVDNFSRLYILDTTWTAENNKRFPIIQYPNFFYIYKGRVRYSSWIRGKIDGYTSELGELIITSDDKNIYINGFGLRLYSTQKSRLSIELIENKSGSVKIHVYTKLGDFDRYFVGHIASDEEVKTTTADWKGEQPF